MADVNTSGQPDTSIYGLLQKPLGPLGFQQAYADLAQTRANTALTNQHTQNAQYDLVLHQMDQVGNAGAALLASHQQDQQVSGEEMSTMITTLRGQGMLPGPMAAALLGQITGDPAKNYQLLQQGVARVLGAKSTLAESMGGGTYDTGYGKTFYNVGTGPFRPQGMPLGQPQGTAFVPGAQTPEASGQVDQYGRPILQTPQQRQAAAEGGTGTPPPGTIVPLNGPNGPGGATVPPNMPGNQGGYAGGLPAGTPERWTASNNQYIADRALPASGEYRQTMSAYQQVLDNIDKAEVGQTSDAKSFLRNAIISASPDLATKLGIKADMPAEQAYEIIKKNLSQAETAAAKDSFSRGTNMQLDLAHMGNPTTANIKEVVKDLTRMQMARSQFDANRQAAYVAQYGGNDALAANNAPMKYADFAANYNKNNDPRAFYYALLPADEQKKYQQEYISKMGKEEKQKFSTTAKMIRDQLPHLGYFQSPEYQAAQQ